MGDVSDPPQFRIEEATAVDLVAVAEVHSKAVIAAYPDVLPPEIFDPKFVAPDKLVNEYRTLVAGFGAQDALLKAVADGKVVGSCACGADTELNETGTGYLQRVYVEPEWWGRGVGSALVDRALELMTGHGFRKAALQVLENNTKARAFYENRGWEYEQVVRVKDVGTELRYAKALAQSQPFRTP